MASLFKSVANLLTPVLKESQFYSNGYLTPEEFVQAGDNLTSTFGTWQWSKGNPERAVPYLPADKQYLISRNVPCAHRISDYFSGFKEKTESIGAEGDNWTVTEFSEGMNKTSEKTTSAEKDKETTEAADNSMADLDDFGLDDDYNDDAAAAPKEDPTPKEQNDVATPATAVADDSSKSKMRSYDLSIVYDKYYRTPCVFLVGKDEFGTPLSLTQIWEDVSSEHSNKTITQGDHPHTGLPQLFIHPCKHASTMKSMLSMIEEEQRESVLAEQEHALAKYERALNHYKSEMEVYQDESKLTKPVKPVFTESATESLVQERLQKAIPVDNYLLLFLKFINTIIPTVDYDFTVSM